MPPHTSNGIARTVANARIADFIPSGPAANDNPPPGPGLYTLDERLLYVTSAGRVFIVRDQVAVQLTPVDDLPEDAEPCDFELDRELCIVAEAADALEDERVELGVYAYGGHFYFVSERGVFLLYGDLAQPVGLPTLPRGAVLFTAELPPSVMASISTLEAAG